MNNRYIKLLTRYLIPIYIAVIILQSLFRIYFEYTFIDDLILAFNDRSELIHTLVKALVKGLRYDWLITSYAFIVPLLTLFFQMLLDRSTKAYTKVFNIYFIVVFALIFAISSIDIPYYKYFYTHPTTSVFNWLGFGSTYGMILQETSYFKYFFIYLLSVAILVAVCLYTKKRIHSNETNGFATNKKKSALLFILCSFFIYFGTNGQFRFSSIDRWSSLFTISTLANDIGISPTYYFLYYFGNKDLEVDYDELISRDQAITFVQQEFNIIPNDSLENPISRFVNTEGERNKQNVVIIYLESLSHNLMHQTVNGVQLTPFLDSLTEKSYYFKNFYSSGTHTNNAIGSTLSSYPALFNTPSMSREPLSYKGITHTLKDLDYQSLFFVTHNLSFDNIAVYFERNNIDTCFNIIHYPKEKVMNSYGVQDDYLYEFALAKLNNAHSMGKPFLANILTISNHPKYVVPERFQNISSNEEESILAFVDNSLKEFMEEASKQAWYENTIFVIHGDHGKVVSGQLYDMPLSLNHVPLFIYSPKLGYKELDNYGTQVDIFPTVMGLLNTPYINNTMGVDLLKDTRRYSYFTSDKAMGCIDDKFFYEQNMLSKQEFLYKRDSNRPDNYIDEYRAIADSMKAYVSSMLVATHHLTEEGLAGKY